jgi:hypothetical protein
MQSTFKIEEEYASIRAYLKVFMVLLVLSGLTAIPVEWELSLLTRFIDESSWIGSWLQQLYTAVKETNTKYPALFYGFDWLAFAHIVIAIAFIGPYRDPVRNKWVIEFGVYACLLVIPFALIMGSYRGIPFWWRILDCSFGLIGLIPLLTCYKKIQKLETITTEN